MILKKGVTGDWNFSVDEIRVPHAFQLTPELLFLVSSNNPAACPWVSATPLASQDQVITLFLVIMTSVSFLSGDAKYF